MPQINKFEPFKVKPKTSAARRVRRLFSLSFAPPDRRCWLILIRMRGTKTARIGLSAFLCVCCASEWERQNKKTAHDVDFASAERNCLSRILHLESSRSKLLIRTSYLAAHLPCPILVQVATITAVAIKSSQVCFATMAINFSTFVAL